MLKDEIEILDKDEYALVNEIRSLGFNIDSVRDLVNNRPLLIKTEFVGPYQAAYPILVKHLKIKHHPCTREGIIRALTEKDASNIASTALLEEFYTEGDKNIKRILANALRTVLSTKDKKKYPEYKEFTI